MRKINSLLLFSLTSITFAQVGINTEKPEAALHIEADSPYNGFILRDGSQANGKVLISNENGAASWKSLFTATENYGEFTWKANENISNVNWNSIANLKVTPGTHMIYYRIHILNNGASDSYTRGAYNRVYVSKRNWKQNPNSRDTPILGTTGFQALQGNDQEIALSFMYTNKSNSDEILYLNFQSDATAVRRSEYAQQSSAIFKNVNLIENYFYAVKVD